MPAANADDGEGQRRYAQRMSENLGTSDDPWQLGTAPVGGWDGLRKGYRGRFGMYLAPLLEQLGLVELEHDPRNNRVRAI
jgi:hypothetical protein